MKQTIKLRESELKRMISESVKRVMNETPLNYDEDNFSGRWTKNPSMDDYVDDEGYLDDPNYVPNSWDDEDWIEGDKDMENEYSWEQFDNKPIAHGLNDYYTVGKGAIPREIDNAITRRKMEKDWTPRQLRNGRINKNKWIKGERDLDSMQERWEDVVKESVRRVLRESFEDDYNTARQNYNRPLWGFEMKNQEGEWQYGDIEYDPTSQTMSCMGVSINVDPSLSVDQNLEALYEELMNNGFGYDED